MGRYPSYNVLNDKEHWDDHTRSIVTSRLEITGARRFLKRHEEALLRVICSHLVDDHLEERIDFVLSHIDETLSSKIGEGQRHIHVPKGPDLIRSGLKALDQWVKKRHGVRFTDLSDAIQYQSLMDLSKMKTPELPEWRKVPPIEFFKKLLSLTLEAYYSHPDVWSEIGYGGPAYPRGYVRTQLGQLDPWEAQPEP